MTDAELLFWLCACAVVGVMGFVGGYVLGIERASRTLTRVARGGQ